MIGRNGLDKVIEEQMVCGGLQRIVIVKEGAMIKGTGDSFSR